MSTVPIEDFAPAIQFDTDLHLNDYDHHYDDDHCSCDSKHDFVNHHHFNYELKLEQQQ